MNIAICEDEYIIRESIEKQIHRLLPQATIRTFESGEQLLQEEQSFQLYLLDIRLHNKNGIEVAKEIRKSNLHTEIIFLTAFEEYVFEAFEVEALHYLVKPIDEEKLAKIIMRATERLGQSGMFLTVQKGAEIICVNLEQLMYAEAQNRKIVLYCKNEQIDYYGRISDLEKELPSTFFKCHRSYLVNLAQIKRYDSQFITVMNQVQIPVARSQYKKFVTQFITYLNVGI